MLNQTVKLIIGASLAGSLVACGGGGSSGVGSTATSSNVPQTAGVPVVVSDASSEDWATIGVKVLSIALLPQGGGSPVTVYTAPTPAPMVNLEELDQLGEILGRTANSGEPQTVAPALEGQRMFVLRSGLGSCNAPAGQGSPQATEVELAPSASHAVGGR